MKIVAEILKIPSGSLIPQYCCLDKSGKVVRSVTDTLLDLIAESPPSELEALASILRLAENGQYKRDDSTLADWSANDKFVWIGLPKTEAGYVLVSNENIPDFADEGGKPQKFSISQFLSAIAHWNIFGEMIRERGKAALLGEQFSGTI